MSRTQFEISTPEDINAAVVASPRLAAMVESMGAERPPFKIGFMFPDPRLDGTETFSAWGVIAVLKVETGGHAVGEWVAKGFKVLSDGRGIKSVFYGGDPVELPALEAAVATHPYMVGLAAARKEYHADIEAKRQAIEAKRAKGGAGIRRKAKEEILAVPSVITSGHGYVLKDLPVLIRNGGAEAGPLASDMPNPELWPVRQSLTVAFGRPGVEATVRHETDQQTGVVITSKTVTGMDWDKVRAGSLEDLALEYLDMSVGLIVSEAPFMLSAEDAQRIADGVALMLHEGRVPDPMVFTSMAFDTTADHARVVALRDTFGIDVAA